MNSGTTGQSSAQAQQQQIAQQQMQDYAKNELPALGYAIRSTQDSEPGREVMAAGQGVQNARVLGGQALQQTAAGASNSGALPGSGAFASRAGSLLPRTAAASAIGETAARMGQKSQFLTGQANLVGQGNKMIDTANQALGIAGGVQSSVQGAQTAANAASHQQAAGLGTAALMAFASSPAAAAAAV